MRYDSEKAMFQYSNFPDSVLWLTRAISTSQLRLGITSQIRLRLGCMERRVGHRLVGYPSALMLGIWRGIL